MTDPMTAAPELARLALELLRPAWLWGLALVPVLWFLYRRSLVDFSRAQRVASLAVRSLVVALLVLALAGLTLLRPTDERYVVFVADESLSVGGEEGADPVRDYLSAVGAVPRGDRAVVLPFAADVGEAVSLAEFLKPVECRREGNAPPNGDGEAGGGEEERRKGTGIAAALRTALAAAPPDQGAAGRPVIRRERDGR